MPKCATRKIYHLHVLVVHEDQAGIDRHVEGGKLRNSGDDPRPRSLETLEAGGEALVVAHLVALPPGRVRVGVGVRDRFRVGVRV